MYLCMLITVKNTLKLGSVSVHMGASPERSLNTEMRVKTSWRIRTKFRKNWASVKQSNNNNTKTTTIIIIK